MKRHLPFRHVASIVLLAVYLYLWSKGDVCIFEYRYLYDTLTSFVGLAFALSLTTLALVWLPKVIHGPFPLRSFATLLAYALIVIAIAMQSRNLHCPDVRRIIDIKTIQQAVLLHERNEGHLPSSLSDLLESRVLLSLPMDPVTHEPYFYSQVGANGYIISVKLDDHSLPVLQEDLMPWNDSLEVGRLSD